MKAFGEKVRLRWPSDSQRESGRFARIDSQKDPHFRGNETIYLHRSGPLLENGLERPKNRYGRYGFPSFYSISISTLGVDEARVFLKRFSFLALWVVVVDSSQFPAIFITCE